MRYLRRVSRSSDPIGLTWAEGYINYLCPLFKIGGDPQKRKGLSLLRPALTIVPFPYSPSTQARTLQASLLAMLFQVSYRPSSPSFSACSPTSPSTVTPYSCFTTTTFTQTYLPVKMIPSSLVHALLTCSVEVPAALRLCSVTF